MTNIPDKTKADLSNNLKDCFYDILIFFSFCLLAAIMTFPLLFKINSCIAGFFSTDEPSLWYLWWLKYAHIHHLSSGYSHLICAPFGIDLAPFEMLYPLWIGIKKILAINFNEFFCYNFEILMGFVLSAFFMYLTLRYLKRSRSASIFSAIIFAFCPYHFTRAWQHIGLAHTEWLALFLLAIFRLKDNVNRKNIIFAFLSLYLIFAFELYYSFFSLVIASLFTIYLIFKDKKLFPRFVFWLTVISLANIAILAVNSLPLLRKIVSLDNSSSAWNLTRPFNDLFSQSARPLSYFLPASVHPFFGRFTENFVGSKLYGMSFTEHTLYLGWVPLILAFIAIQKWQKDKKLRVTSYELRVTDKERFYIAFFILLALAAWLLSQPPWWDFAGFKIYMPSFFIYKLLPVFRAYCRFGIVVMLAVAVLAGFGLDFFLRQFQTRRARAAVIILAYGLALFEFWNYPPFKIISFETPQAYQWLKAQSGDFNVAEYPLDIDGPNEIYKFYQTRHKKKIINGTIPGTYANKLAREISRLSEFNTAVILKMMGVKYVLVHRREYLATGLMDYIEEPEKIRANPGLRAVKLFPASRGLAGNTGDARGEDIIDVYEVVATPTNRR